MDPATSTVEALSRVADNINLMVFVYGWTSIVIVAALSAAIGWKLWKG